MSNPTSRYLSLSRDQWQALRDPDDFVPFTEEQLQALRGINDRLSLDDVREVHLPLARFIALQLAGVQHLVRATHEFLNVARRRMPFIVGIAGSVAVGKSTTARVLRHLLSLPRYGFRTDLVTTDGFLLPTQELDRRGLILRKGFPESYDLKLLLDFLSTVKSGAESASAPVYSHVKYDRIPDERIVVRRPDILIIEGLNILQSPPPEQLATDRLFASDFIDLSIFLHAEEKDLRAWYIERFLTLRETVFANPESHFRQYARLSDTEAIETASGIWETINAPNLRENILPTRFRADVILNKHGDHEIGTIHIKRR
jgi:type I pantothenate kinase